MYREHLPVHVLSAFDRYVHVYEQAGLTSHEHFEILQVASKGKPLPQTPLEHEAWMLIKSFLLTSIREIRRHYKFHEPYSDMIQEVRVLVENYQKNLETIINTML